MIKKFIFFWILFAASVAYAGPQGTSSTTGANMILRARVYLSEPTEIRWDDDDLLQFLNDGMVDIAAKTKGYQASELISLGADTIEYTPTADYLEIVAVVCNPASGSSWGLIKSNISSLGRATEAATPVYWYEFGGKIGVFPAYSAVTTEAVTVYYTVLPEAITSSGTVATPAYLDKALVYYIVAQALLLDQRVQEANNYLNLYMAELDRYRQDFVEGDNETDDPIR
jgi:hypothetical protein